MKQSAGLLLYRRRAGRVEVLLVHPGGPFWAKRDEHGWSFPKGEFAAGEDPLLAARREFEEETGTPPPGGPMLALGSWKSAGKVMHCWAIEAEFDPAALRSNSFTLEWPPRSGTLREFPEVDRAGWFDLETARRKIHKGQVPLIDALAKSLDDA